jgi:hypothetical protein
MTGSAVVSITPGVVGATQKENPRRGASYRDFAIAFRKQWAPGDVLTWTEFCAWAVDIGLMDEPEPTEPDGAPLADKRSTIWLAHLQRRHQARSSLNKAASHSTMQPYGGAYVLETLSQQHGTMVVRSVVSALAQAEAARQVESLAITKRKQLGYLLQSADWSVLPPHEKAFAEALYDDIDYFVGGVARSAEHLQKKFSNLQRRLAALVESGQLRLANGGVRALLENAADDEESAVPGNTQ